MLWLLHCYPSWQHTAENWQWNARFPLLSVPLNGKIRGIENFRKIIKLIKHFREIQFYLAARLFLLASDHWYWSTIQYLEKPAQFFSVIEISRIDLNSTMTLNFADQQFREQDSTSPKEKSQKNIYDKF